MLYHGCVDGILVQYSWGEQGAESIHANINWLEMQYKGID